MSEERDVVSARIGVNLEREKVVAFLRSEANAARYAQSNAADDHPDKLYRMGQKDGLLLAAEAIERGHHIPRCRTTTRPKHSGEHL